MRTNPAVGDSGAGVVRVGGVVARDGRCACRGRRRRSGIPLPRGEVVDAALVMKAGVRV